MKYLSRLSLTFLILFLACCCNKEPPRNDITGLPNFAKVSETLYRGAQPGKEGFTELKKMGVKTIINLRGYHSDRDLIKGLGFQYIEIPLNAGDTDEKNVIKFLKAVANPNNGIIFVHCQHGSDRTGMMIAIYRMFVQGWTADEAMQELPSFGFHEIYSSIREYISKFDVQLMRQKVESAPMPEAEIVR